VVFCEMLCTKKRSGELSSSPGLTDIIEQGSSASRGLGPGPEQGDRYKAPHRMRARAEGKRETMRSEVRRKQRGKAEEEKKKKRLRLIRKRETNNRRKWKE